MFDSSAAAVRLVEPVFDRSSAAAVANGGIASRPGPQIPGTVGGLPSVYHASVIKQEILVHPAVRHGSTVRAQVVDLPHST